MNRYKEQGSRQGWRIMKESKSLRERLIPAIFFASLFTIGLFALVSQYKLKNNIKENLHNEIKNGMEKSNQCLDMVFDKYETILYEVCGDDEIIQLVERLNREEPVLDKTEHKLRRELSHICSSNKNIGGIVVTAANGKQIFYDSLTSSFENSRWIDQVEIPVIQKGNQYGWLKKPVHIGNEEIYLFQISRSLADYQDIHQEIGTAAIIIQEKELRLAIETSQDNHVYLREGNQIISASDRQFMGKDANSLPTKGYHVTEQVNQRTGWIIQNNHSLDGYQRTVWEQAFYHILIAVGTVGIMLMLIRFITNPVIQSVDAVVDAMNEAEKGNFSVKIKVHQQMPREIIRIAEGFNQMVEEMDELIRQAKQAAVDQKNAELSALEAQIDPHFLYNTLDTINWKAIEQEQYEISEMVGALADILRYAVKNAGAQVTVSQEISWLNQYILLQSAKLGRALEMKYRISEEAKSCRIHKLLLQPFVENSIKHGFYEKKGVCRLEVSMDVMKGQLYIVIGDNGKGMKEEMLSQLNDEKAALGDHLGIINVRKRLKLYYSEGAGIYFESSLGNYTKVHLFIPVEEADHADSSG